MEKKNSAVCLIVHTASISQQGSTEGRRGQMLSGSGQGLRGGGEHCETRTRSRGNGT